MYARRRRAYFRDHRQFRAGPRAPIHQPIKHARPRRFADGSRNSRRRMVRFIFRIHSLMLNEV
jgi:hypothetical protein